MSDLSAGAHANVILNIGQRLRVSAAGVATVVAQYGAPNGTTTVTAGTQDFGPYTAPAKLRVTATSGSVSYIVLEQSAVATGSMGRLLVFGNSIAGQSCRGFTGNQTIVNAANEGATSLTINDATGYATSSKVAINTGAAGVFPVVLTGVAGNVISFANHPLPVYVPGGNTRSCGLYTTQFPLNIRLGSGAWAMANAVLGSPLDLVNGYGFGGALASQMILDLGAYLRFYRPAFVALHLLENDIGTAATAASLQQIVRTAALMCIEAGAVPLVCSPLPNTSYSNTSAVKFDALRAYCLDIGNVVPGAIAVNLSDLYRDTAQDAAGYRTPLAGWTDGVHPNANKQITIASSFIAVVAGLFGMRSSMIPKALAGMGFNMAGTGGTTSGAGAITATAVAAGVNVSVDAGISVTLTKSPRDTQRITITAASGAGYIQVTKNGLALPSNAGGQSVKGFMKFIAVAASNLSIVYGQINFGTGGYASCHQDSGLPADPLLIGAAPTFTTPMQRIPSGEATVDVRFVLYVSAGCTAVIDVDELGIVSGGPGEIFDRSILAAAA